MSAETRLLTATDIDAAATLADHVGAAERAFRMLAAGEVGAPAPLHLVAAAGGLHAKAAAASIDGHDFAAVKVNANFPGNPGRGLPTIQGALLLFDGGCGRLLAIMDSASITTARTAAATAVAAARLARADAAVATICGCGEQGGAQLAALLLTRPIQRVFVFDADPERARCFAERAAARHGIAVDTVAEPGLATRRSDIVVTCTSATRAFVDLADVRPGTFIAAVGADAPHKSEIAPALMAAARVVTDVTRQCAHMGDLHHAIAAGLMREADVAGELGAMLAGVVPAPGADDTVVFDSTGTGAQDLLAAATILRRAEASGAGTTIAFA